MSVAGRHAAEAGRRTVRRGRRPAAPVDREKTLLIDRLRPACSLGSMTCLPGLRVRAAGAFAASEGGYGYRRVKAMPRTRVSEKVLRSPVP